MTFIGTNLSYLPMFLAGLLGMPRRVVDYTPEFTTLNQLASLGGFLLGISVLPFLYTAIVSWARGPKVDANPWRALTLEWTVSSPPPDENFETQPEIERGPYDFGDPSLRWDTSVSAPVASD
jgi:cytochrome c oxidase subunit 1